MRPPRFAEPILAGLLLLGLGACADDPDRSPPSPDPPPPAAPSPSPTASGAELREASERIVELRLAGERQRALDLAVASLETWPDAPGLHYEVGVLRAATGDPEGAIAPLERSVALDAGAMAPWRALGRTRERLGATVEAIEAYRRCLELEPTQRDCRFGFGRSLVAEERPQEAEPHLRAAAEGDGAGAEEWAELARLRVRLGRLDDGREAWSRALAADRHHLPTLLGYGQTLIRLGRREEGEALLALHRELATQADRIDALDRQTRGGDAPPEVWLALADAHLLREDREAAESVWERALERTPDLLDAELALVGSHLSDGRVDAAEERLAGLLQRAPSHPALPLLSGLLAIERGSFERAAAAFESSRRLALWQAGQWVGVARAWLDAGRLREARRAFAAALDLEPRNAAALRGQAEALRQAGLPHEAMDHARRALEAEPADPDLWLTIALLQEEQGLEEEARRSFANAVDLQAFDLLAADGLERLEERFEAHHPGTSARGMWRRVLGERDRKLGGEAAGR